MCQSLNSCDYLIVEARYKMLCHLYNRYKIAIKTVVENVFQDSIANKKLNELDYILSEIENYPIPWSFYSKQKNKFSHDFENLIVFKDDLISIN